jgi:hypothetical protein
MGRSMISPASMLRGRVYAREHELARMESREAHKGRSKRSFGHQRLSFLDKDMPL